MRKRIVLFKIDQRKKVNSEMIIADMKLKELCRVGDFKKGSIPMLYKNDSIKSIVIAIYKNKKGEQKRRIASLPKWLDKKEGVEQARMVAMSLGIEVERTLEVLES